ncbi:hypothetical protein C8R46DRAFT_1350371 [Mycena filopes]|nr:hypothetical protein C8R46DRAFT_1350371 [Mycena filopes]
MHPALCIPEIVALICELAPAASPGTSYRSSLAALAQSHSSFQEPALDVLWREMHSVVPLLKCFPADLWEVSDLHIFNFIRVIRPDDWTRVWSYASRIRDIDFNNESLLLSSSLADSLHLALCGRQLLPKLERMSWDLGGFPYRHFTAFLGPVATKVIVTITSAPSYMARLTTLATRVPPLTELTILGWGRGRSELETFETVLIKHLHHLQILSMPVFQAATLQHLATLKDLRSLSLATRTMAPDSEPVLVPSAFRSLRHLALDAQSIPWATHIISMLRNHILSELSLKFTVYEFAEAYTALNKLICQHCAPLALTSFSATYHEAGIPTSMSSSYTLSADLLTPLYECRNLRTVVIRASRISLTDADVGELAACWPRIEHLDVYSGLRANDDQLRPTLSALALLADRCPYLGYLGLDLDARVVPPRTDVPPHLNLKKINVHMGVIESSSRVAAYIGGLFPALEAVEGQRDNPMLRYQRWMRMLERILDARRDEK